MPYTITLMDRSERAMSQNRDACALWLALSDCFSESVHALRGKNSNRATKTGKEIKGIVYIHGKTLLKDFATCAIAFTRTACGQN